MLRDVGFQDLIMNKNDWFFQSFVYLFQMFNRRQLAYCLLLTTKGNLTS